MFKYLKDFNSHEHLCRTHPAELPLAFRLFQDKVDIFTELSVARALILPQGLLLQLSPYASVTSTTNEINA